MFKILSNTFDTKKQSTRAIEEYAKHLLDLSGKMYTSGFWLLTVFPASLIVKSSVDDKFVYDSLSLQSIMSSVPASAAVSFMSLFAFMWALAFWSKARAIHLFNYIEKKSKEQTEI